MKLRENALLKVEPKVIMSPTKTTFTGDGPRYQTGPSLMGRSNGLAVGGGRYPWKLNIVTTIFWVGERPSGNNPVQNDKSSWDKYWSGSYVGDHYLHPPFRFRITCRILRLVRSLPLRYRSLAS